MSRRKAIMHVSTLKKNGKTYEILQTALLCSTYLQQKLQFEQMEHTKFAQIEHTKLYLAQNLDSRVQRVQGSNVTL